MIAICPTPEKLKSLSLGQLPEEQSDQLLIHLQSCESCQNEMVTIDLREDTLIEQLRTVSTESEDSFHAETECRAATARALAALATVEANTHSLPPNMSKTIGEYEIVSPLGHGGMGNVFLGRHTKLGRPVAIKFIADHRRWDKTMRKRFASEMQMIGGLDHPNIVHAHDAREVDGVAVLVTEFIDGLDASEIVKLNGQLSVADASAITAEICKALGYINRRGLVHRDIKPSNIMIDRAGQVKLLDLGLARLQESDTDLGDFTATGQAIGTADYVAPEQINDGRNVDIRTDIYGLGCTLYKFLSGRAPFADAKFPSAFAKMNAHLTEQPEPIDSIRDDLPGDLVKLVHQMLHKDADARPQTVESIEQRLANFSSSADLQTLVNSSCDLDLSSLPAKTPVKPAAAKQPKTSSFLFHRVPFVAAIAAGLAGILLGIFFGIVLTVKKPDGTIARVEIPNGSSAVVDEKGNIEITLAGGRKLQMSSDDVEVKRQIEMSGLRPPAIEVVEYNLPITLKVTAGPEQPIYSKVESGDKVDVVARLPFAPNANREGLYPSVKLLVPKLLIASNKKVGNIHVSQPNEETPDQVKIISVSIDQREQDAWDQAKSAGYRLELVAHDPNREIIHDRMQLNGVWQTVFARINGEDYTSLCEDQVNLIARRQIIYFANDTNVRQEIHISNDNGQKLIGFRLPGESDFVTRGRYRFLPNGRLEFAISMDATSVPSSFEDAEVLTRFDRVNTPETPNQELAFETMNSLSAKVKLEMFIAEKDGPFDIPASYKAAIEPSGQKVWLHPEPVITNDDLIAALAIDYSPRTNGISIQLTDEAAVRMAHETAHAVGKLIAIFIDGKLVSAPEIHEPISDNAAIQGHFEQELIDKWVAGIVPEFKLPPGRASVAIDDVNPLPALAIIETDVDERSKQNVRDLILAMHNYHDDNNSLPPSQVQRAETKKHSWRVAILPFLDQMNLYNEYHFDEEWDSPDNKKLLAKMPDVYRHPSAKPDSTTTNYVGFASDETGLGVSQGVSLVDFKDGLSLTVLLIQAETDIPWTKPEDLPFDDETIESIKYVNGEMVLGYADAHVEYSTAPEINKSKLKRLLTRSRNDNER